MSDAYQAWRETREHLKQEPDSAFLQRVEETLRPAALLAFLGSFRGLDTYEEPLECTPKQAEVFLAELDELRQPTYREDETRAEMQREVSEALTAMRKLPWTGDHLYGDALDDASLVLRAVLAGKGWPVLERFRCPSVIGNGIGAGRMRCELQLPHESAHRLGGTTWTDEQSVNPPKNYDETTTVLGRCGSEWQDLTCFKDAGHPGPHQADPAVTAGNICTWPDSYSTRNPDPINRPPGPENYATGTACPSKSAGGVEECALPLGHEGRHQGAGAAPLSWPRKTNELTGEQLDDLAAEVFEDGECGAVNPNPVRHGKSICVRAKAHGGLHRDADGIRWEK